MATGDRIYLADKETLDKNIEQTEKLYDNAIHQEVSGDVVSVNDSSNLALVGLKLFGKTTQDGTPTPDAPVPIVSAFEDGGWVNVAGANLLNPADYRISSPFAGLTVIQEGDEVTLSGTYAGEIVADIDLKTYEVKIPSGNYRLMGCPKGGATHTYRLFANIKRPNGTIEYQSDYGDGVQFVINDGDTLRITIRVGNEWVAGSSQTFRPMLTPCEDVKEFESYKPAQTIPISMPDGLSGIPVTSGGNYTDANGQQWVCDEVDFARGVYVQRVNTIVFDGTETLSKSTAGTLMQAKFVITNKARNHAERYSGLSTHYFVRRLYEDGNKPYIRIGSGANELWFEYTLAQMSDVNALKTYLAEQYAAGKPVTVTYAIDTPIETPLSAEEIAAFKALHSNKPNTTVYNDSGAGMSVEYIADTKTYIDNKFTELQNAILSAGANV